MHHLVGARLAADLEETDDAAQILLVVDGAHHHHERLVALPGPGGDAQSIVTRERRLEREVGGDVAAGVEDDDAVAGVEEPGAGGRPRVLLERQRLVDDLGRLGGTERRVDSSIGRLEIRRHELGRDAECRSDVVEAVRDAVLRQHGCQRYVDAEEIPDRVLVLEAVEPADRAPMGEVRGAQVVAEPGEHGADVFLRGTPLALRRRHLVRLELLVDLGPERRGLAVEVRLAALEHQAATLARFVMTGEAVSIDEGSELALEALRCDRRPGGRRSRCGHPGALGGEARGQRHGEREPDEGPSRWRPRLCLLGGHSNGPSIEAALAATDHDSAGEVRLAAFGDAAEGDAPGLGGRHAMPSVREEAAASVSGRRIDRR